MLKSLSKICDAADWFDRDFRKVIENELREPAKFHRKQWEFAIIFLALEKYGLLNENKIGLSMGGGCERVLYPIANKVKKLFVTDLYSSGSEWDTARASDPKEFIKSNQPFYVDENRYEAINMDMRNLKFEDESFDFCYSSCAIEHIGDYKDFEIHLNEVHRVLKDGGLYVLTTEFLFAEETIKDEHNYYFSPSYLSNVILNSNLVPLEDPLIELTDHVVNYPLPSNPENYLYREGNFCCPFFGSVIPHIILLRGRYPFTSVSLILKKQSQSISKPFFDFKGLEKSKTFLLRGVESFLEKINKSRLNINPFSGLPDGVSHYFYGHEEFFNTALPKGFQNNLVFHSDYIWLGNGKRILKVRILFDPASDLNQADFLFRIQKFSTYNAKEIECIFEKELIVSNDGVSEIETILDCNEEFNYAFLSKIIYGNPLVRDIQINLSPVGKLNESQNHFNSIIDERLH